MDGSTYRNNRVFFAVLLAVCLFGFSPSLEARVTSVTTTVNPAEFAGPCPSNFNFAGIVQADAAGEVQVRWLKSDGVSSHVITLNFSAPGQKRVSLTWSVGRVGNTVEGWAALAVLSPNPLVSNRAVFKLNCDPKPGSRFDASKRPFPQGCVDPAAISLQASIVERISATKARIRVTGMIRNIGEREFIAGPNQAKAILTITFPGSTPEIVMQQEIRNLAAGAEFELHHGQVWDCSSQNEGEFPANFQLLISLDPDIRSDDNIDNDDCNMANNQKDLRGSEINTLVRGR